jgi:hypothetical protein
VKILGMEVVEVEGLPNDRFIFGDLGAIARGEKTAAEAAVSVKLGTANRCEVDGVVILGDFSAYVASFPYRARIVVPRAMLRDAPKREGGKGRDFRRVRDVIRKMESQR